LSCLVYIEILSSRKTQPALFSDSISKDCGNFLQEDIVQYEDNIDDLSEKLLLLENEDFELSQNNKLVITMKAHALTSQEK